MKLRNSFGNRAFTGLAALLVTTGGTASAGPTLRMRPAPRRLAQATPPAQPSPVQPPPAQPPPAQPAQTPPAQPPPAALPDAPAPDAAPTPAPAPAPDATPAPAPAAPPPAYPPATPDDTQIPTDETLAGAEVVVVTGSRIGDPLGKQAPVLMMSREDIERTGLTSVGDILQQLPVSGGAINGKYNSSGNFGFPPDSGGIGAGATEADLRYLGSKRVLVLVDGVRWVNGSSASGVSASTDLNTIPIGIIERIEVLEDGASPLYGSDAIAGVINIITRKEVSGVMASVYTGAFHQGDGVVQKYDVSWGATNGKLSTVVGGSYVDQRAVFSGDRSISAYPIPGVGRCTDSCSGTGPNGRVIYYTPNPDGTTTKHDVALEPGTRGGYHPFTDDDRFNYQPYNYDETPSQRLNIFSALTYKATSQINVRGKASFNNRQSINQAAPEPVTLGPGAHNNSRLDNIVVDVTNPYNPFGFTFDPATTGEYEIARRQTEAGPRTFEQNVHTFYTSGGLDGHFDLGGQRFVWDATVAYGLNRAEQRRNNAVNSAKLQQGLGPAYMGSDGRYHCGVSAANPGDPSCVPVDFFDGPGTITPDMLKYITFTEHDVSEQTMVDSVANLSGNLVQLPAGWLAAAVGVEHRRLSGFYEPDAVIAAGDAADTVSLPTSGRYSVNEAYAELRAPLITNLPGAELLDVNAAGRVSDYSFLSPKFTGKVGGRWKPTKDLVLRGSFGSGFRAPAIGELYGSKAQFAPVLSDPCSDFLNTGVSDTVRARCIALGVPANGSYKQSNQQIGITTGGNRDLTPETSTSINISLAYSPVQLQNQPWVDSLDLELAYYDIRLDNAISAIDTKLQLDQCVLQNDDKACMGIVRSPAGAIASFDNVLQNIGGLNVRGLDLTLSYRSPRQSFGRLRAVSQSSYMLAYETKTPSGSGFTTTNLVGTVSGTPTHAFPKLKSNLTLSLLYKAFDITLITRYIHSVTEPCPALFEFPGTCSNPNADDTKATNKLGITVYNDAQVVWSPQFDRQLTVTAGVNNFTDRDPPKCFSCSLNGFEGTTYDVPGVFGYLSATYHLQ